MLHPAVWCSSVLGRELRNAVRGRDEKTRSVSMGVRFVHQARSAGCFDLGGCVRRTVTQVTTMLATIGATRGAGWRIQAFESLLSRC